jgi:hypothetical protein
MSDQDFPLPALPRSSRGNSGYWGWSGEDVRTYALAAREPLLKVIAERDTALLHSKACLDAASAEIERLNGKLVAAKLVEDRLRLSWKEDTEREQRRAEAAEQRAERLRAALQEVEAHHVELNTQSRRPIAHSKTISICRAALASDEGGET